MAKDLFYGYSAARILLIMALVLTSVSTFAQGNFKMTGTLTDVDDDSVVVEYVERNPDKKIIDLTFPVKSGQFQFTLNLDKAYSGTIKLKSNPKEIVYFFFVPDEEADIRGTLESKYALEISGSHFYLQYAKIIDMNKPFSLEFESARNKYNRGIADGGDEKQLDEERKAANREINKRYYKSNYDYICKHTDEDATATMVTDVELDSVIHAIDMLSPKVRNGRFGGYLAFWKKAIERFALENKAKNSVSDTVRTGETAPDFTLKDIQNKPFTLSSARGKYVVLDFWGSWCGWCIKGFPKLKEYYAKYKDRLEIIGIDCNDKTEAWKTAVKKHQIPWLQVQSEDAKTEVAYAVKGYPYKVIIAPDGKVLKTFLGEKDDFYNYLDEIMSEK